MPVKTIKTFKRQEEERQTLYQVGDIIENEGSAAWALRHEYGEEVPEQDAGAEKSQGSAPQNKAKQPPKNKGAQ